MTPSQAVVLAVVVIVPAAIAGGFVGGWIRRGFPLLGAFLALTVAWMTGIVLLPLTADLLDIPLRTAISCVMDCQANLRSDEPLGGAAAYARSIVNSVIFLPLTAVPIAFLVLAKRWDTGQSLIPVFFAVLTHAGLHAAALSSGGALIPYLCLAVGVMIWAVWLRSRDPRWHRSRYGSIIPRP
jgi:hypothetical protein